MLSFAGIFYALGRTAFQPVVKPASSADATPGRPGAKLNAALASPAPRCARRYHTIEDGAAVGARISLGRFGGRMRLAVAAEAPRQLRWSPRRRNTVAAV